MRWRLQQDRLGLPILYAFGDRCGSTDPHWRQVSATCRRFFELTPCFDPMSSLATSDENEFPKIGSGDTSHEIPAQREQCLGMASLVQAFFKRLDQRIAEFCQLGPQQVEVDGFGCGGGAGLRGLDDRRFGRVQQVGLQLVVFQQLGKPCRDRSMPSAALVLVMPRRVPMPAVPALDRCRVRSPRCGIIAP